jgi:hypothetical protein
VYEEQNGSGAQHSGWLQIRPTQERRRLGLDEKTMFVPQMSPVHEGTVTSDAYVQHSETKHSLYSHGASLQHML